MIKQAIPESDDEVLFEVTLTPEIPVFSSLDETKSMGDGKVHYSDGQVFPCSFETGVNTRYKSNFFRRKEPKEFMMEDITLEEIRDNALVLFGNRINKATVGKPRSMNLISAYLEEKKEVLPYIQKMASEYDFYAINLFCSFLPDKDCAFTWARFSLALDARKDDSGELLQERPIVYDMFPNVVSSEIKCKKERDYGLDFKIDNVVDAKLYGNKDTKEMIIYEPTIMGYGTQTSDVCWDFRDTMSKGIWGNKSQLFLVVQTPKNSSLWGKFSLEVEAVIEMWGKFKLPFTSRKDKLVDRSYPLSSSL